jgi:hypothetical protein
LPTAAIFSRYFPVCLTATFEPNVRALLSTALDTALALHNPSPPPEPTIVVVQEDDGSADLGNPNFGVEQEAPFLVLTILLRPDESTGTAQVARTADLPVRRRTVDNGDTSDGRICADG